MVGPQSLQTIPNGLGLHLQTGVEPLKYLLRHAKTDLDVIVDALVTESVVGNVFEDDFE